MLVVDPEKRFTVDQCLAHPWLTKSATAVNDSTGGLVGGIASLEVNRRAPPRERTMLSSLNSVAITTRLPPTAKNENPVKVFAKNKHRVTNANKEAGPAHQRATGEFMEMGGKGDETLFGEDESSIYPSQETISKPTQKAKSDRQQ